MQRLPQKRATAEGPLWVESGQSDRPAGMMCGARLGYDHRSGNACAGWPATCRHANKDTSGLGASRRSGWLLLPSPVWDVRLIDLQVALAGNEDLEAIASELLRDNFFGGWPNYDFLQAVERHVTPGKFHVTD